MLLSFRDSNNHYSYTKTFTVNRKPCYICENSRTECNFAIILIAYKMIQHLFKNKLPV